MHILTSLILDDMKPALGVTEPAAIALAVSYTRKYLGGSVKALTIALNSGMYKNAFTCGVPGVSDTGILISAALGLVAGQPEKGLEVLSGITGEERKAAKELVSKGLIRAKLASISSDISIIATLETEEGWCEAAILHSHTNLQYVKVNGTLVYGLEPDEDGDHSRIEASAGSPTDTFAGAEKACLHPIHRFSLEELLHYTETVPAEELAPLLAAYQVNLELFSFSMASDRTVIARTLLSGNGGTVLSDDEKATAQLLSGGAIEGRVLGLDRPAMSITGSGAHGIICTMPLYAVQKCEGLSEELLLRATALSYLITMYIKEYSGRLSAFCGCGIAAGTGMACAVAWMKARGSGKEAAGCQDTAALLTRVINNMSAGITGMICDGGNHGCTMKSIVAVDAAWRAVDLALSGISIEPEHGICARRPEDTMRQMGLIADPGMKETERTILDIMTAKAERS